MTLCNLSIEGGARAGMVAPDEITFAYLKGRPLSPKGADWDKAVAYWKVHHRLSKPFCRRLTLVVLLRRLSNQTKELIGIESSRSRLPKSLLPSHGAHLLRMRCPSLEMFPDLKTRQLKKGGKESNELWRTWVWRLG